MTLATASDMQACQPKVVRSLGKSASRLPDHVGLEIEITPTSPVYLEVHG